MRELSLEEVDEVNGAWGLPGFGIGALAGATGYLGNAMTSGEFSWSGLATATAVGGGLGAIAGPMGAARAYFYPRAAFVGGAAIGYANNCP